MKKLILLLALFAIAGAARAATDDHEDVLSIYGPPRSRVHTLSAHVSRVKRPLPIISARVTPGMRPDEARDLQRSLNRHPVPSMRTVGQTPTAAPGIPYYEPEDGRDIVVQ